MKKFFLNYNEPDEVEPVEVNDNDDDGNPKGPDVD